MPVLGIIASSISGRLDNGVWTPLQVLTVGPSNATSITFSNIPTTGYANLQIRGISCGVRADYRIGEAEIIFNSDTTASYACNDMYADGAGPFATALSGRSNIRIAPGTMGGNAGGTAVFGSFIFDILDYANTNKFKTLRGFSGVDLNGTYGSIGGRLGITSGLWMKTAAISSITITSTGASPFLQYSQFALYGVKSA